MSKEDPIIAISGGLDPLHVGHLRMIKDASTFGKVLVILNSDEWLRRKKSYNFMSWADRAEIVSSYVEVWKVIPVDDSDGTVVNALKEWTPDYFGNGGDRIDNNTPEKKLCEELGIEMVWNLGGGKIRSSSSLVTKAGYDSTSFESYQKYRG